MIGTNTQPLNQWREVCRWEVSRADLFPGNPVADRVDRMPIVRVDWPVDWNERLSDEREAFSNMAAAFEELAGEHRELWEAFMRDAEALSTPCPGDPEDYTFVRAYYRPRRSKLAAIDPDQGTVQAAPGEGQTGASGDVVAASEPWPEWCLIPGKCIFCANTIGTDVCHACGPNTDWQNYVVLYPIPQSGEERSE